jgi:ABC-type transporter Mla MlaB component
MVNARKDKRMTLRIERSAESESVIFTLSGRIQMDMIPELKELLSAAQPDQGVVLDLKEVRLVDRDVVQFLAQLERDGARFRHCSWFIREWILQERRGMQDTQTDDGRSGQERG